MRISPDEIDVELPRAVIGGLKRGPTEELLRRVAADYALVYGENKRLKAAVERLEREANERVEPEQPSARPDDGSLTEQTAAIATAEPPSVTVPVREQDELARVVLAATQRAAREMRESARRDCELMLKKTKTRLREVERARVKAEGELEALEVLKRETYRQMRVSLRTILPQLTAAGAE